MVDLINGLGGAAGFGEFQLNPTDDGSSAAIDITSIFGTAGINFYGTYYKTLFVNNNGNISLGQSYSGYSVPSLSGVNVPIIAPYFFDADTRGTGTVATPGGTSTGSNRVYYDLDTDNHIFTATWDDVGYYDYRTDQPNAFQLRLSDKGNGDFDIELRYEAINHLTWHDQVIGGVVGFTSGDGDHYLAFPGSGTTSILDIEDSLGNSEANGAWGFQIRAGLPLNEAPTDINLSATTVAENAAGAVVGALSTDDPDEGDIHTYALVSGGGDDDNGLFEIVGDKLKLKDGVALDFEAASSHTVRVRTTDFAGLTFENSLTITVTDVYEAPPNAAPSFTGPSQLSIGENQFLVAPLAATDPNGDTLSYKITGGDDAALFTIDAGTGALSFIQAPDFEAPGSAAGSNDYQVRVEVSDGSRNTSKLFHVSVTDGDDEIVGATTGNGVFQATDAFEHFLGGDGRDTVVFTGARDDYTIEVQPDGTITVAYGSGIDTLSSIERLQFDDGTLAFDFDGTAGQAYRLYQAAFDRAPDGTGLGFWIDYLDDGTVNLDMVADLFEASAEFIRLYGTVDSVSTAAFIELLYQNALGRGADADGFAFWLSNLDSGSIDRHDALAFFSESPENIDQTSPAITEGMWYA